MHIYFMVKFCIHLLPDRYSTLIITTVSFRTSLCSKRSTRSWRFQWVNIILLPQWRCSDCDLLPSSLLLWWWHSDVTVRDFDEVVIKLILTFLFIAVVSYPGFKIMLWIIFCIMFFKTIKWIKTIPNLYICKMYCSSIQSLYWENWLKVMSLSHHY